MNATGESDLVNYIDLLVGLQRSIFDPRIHVIDKILQAHYQMEPWEYEWNSIFPESDGERAKRASDLAAAMDKLVSKGILSAQVANNVLAQEKVFGTSDLGSVVTPPEQNNNNNK